MNDTHLSEKVVADKQLYGGRIIDVRLLTVELPGGASSTREVVRHNGAAAVVAVDDQNRVAMVRQFRVAPGKVLLEIPAGKKDSPDEDPLFCARRELREETGLTARSMTLLTDMLSTPGFSNEVISIYLATGLSQGDRAPDEGEFLDVLWEDFSEMATRSRRGEIPDSKTALGLLLADAVLNGQ